MSRGRTSSRPVRWAADCTYTVILSSHILSEVKAVCDKALILSQGHLAAVVDLATEERDLEELFLELTAPEETSDKKED